ncbi:MAG: hypothetical protein KAT30_15365, partial [Candidatus Krumholzibacteria bacterium]|nr:hypothetical protein [Candidatus Krumholzibacteria bacterium]
MKTIVTAITAVLLVGLGCSPKTEDDVENPYHYTSFSRFTDPGEKWPMLEKLPTDLSIICEVAKRQTVHHDLLSYFGVPREEWDGMDRVWPPRMSDILSALEHRPPHTLYADRPVEQRIIGACMLESHLLAGMLRYTNIPARIRAGYFKNVRGNTDVVISFWEDVSRAEGIEQELLEQDATAWKQAMNRIAQEQIDVNHYIEHWICEYWDEEEKRWRLLDANNTFLFASSGIKVGFHLPGEYFEYAFEAWKKMRKDKNFNPDQYM